MTYFGSNWTRGELGADIPRNAPIDCDQCGKTHGFQDYWKERYVDDKSWNPNGVAWLCDECIEQAKAEYELHKKKQLNAQLTEFAP